MRKEKKLIFNNTRFKTIPEIFDIDDKFSIIAGPCAVESLNQMEQVAKVLVGNKIRFIRGGAYKPRTSPYDFQGIGVEGLKILDFIRKEYKLLTVSEILDPRDVEIALEYVDIIQVGSRNMMNYSLLKEIGLTNHPVLLKRGIMSTISEFLLSAEYIVSGGNKNVIMCERGIRTFENRTRNTLDISCIAIIKQETSLPIIADLSHSLGCRDVIKPVLNAVKACGADGVMLEVCPDRTQALSDSKQQLNLNEFIEIVK